MKKSLMEKIATFIEKHFKLSIILFVVFVIAVPILINTNYNSCSNRISADGILSYIGAIITGVTTLFVACVALYQNQQNIKSNEELALMQHRDKIRPAISVKLNKIEDDLFEITIGNIGDCYVKNIKVSDSLIFSDVKCHETKQKIINFNNKIIPEAITIEYLEIDYITINGYPKILYLSFTDIDDNNISQEFVLTADNRYVAQPLMYCDKLR